MSAEGSSWVTVPDQTGMSSLLMITSRYSIVGLRMKSMYPLVYVKCIYACDGAVGRFVVLVALLPTTPVFVFDSPP